MTPSEEIQGQRLFSAIPNQKVGRKFGNISLVNHSQIIEKNKDSRSNPVDWCTINPPRHPAGLDSNTDKGNIIFSLQFSQWIITVKLNCIILGLIIYKSAAKMMIDHISSF